MNKHDLFGELKKLETRVIQLEIKVSNQTEISRARDNPILSSSSRSLHPRRIYSREYALKSVVELILRHLHLDLKHIPEQPEKMDLVSTAKPVKPKKQGGKK